MTREELLNSILKLMKNMAEGKAKQAMWALEEKKEIEKRYHQEQSVKKAVIKAHSWKGKLSIWCFGNDSKHAKYIDYGWDESAEIRPEEFQR